MTEQEWINLGKKRILNILKKYTACTPSQMEIKISEAGPYNQRVEPVILKDSRTKLLQEKIIDEKKERNSNFFYIKNTDGRKVTQRVKKLVRIHEEYEKISQKKELCGNILEYMIQKAIEQSGEYYFLCTVFKNDSDGVFAEKEIEIISFNGKLLPSKNSLDILAFHKKTQIPIGIEVKNKRAWKYAEDCEIWSTINKCCILGIFPIFVSRKISDLAQFTLKEIGMLGMESQFQYFHPSLKNRMIEIINKNDLGFADIKFTADPLPYMVEYFKTVVPLNIERYYSTFLKNKNILTDYCTYLADENFRGLYRTKKFNELKKSL